MGLPSQFGQGGPAIPGLWPRGISALKASVINAELPSVLLPWTSSIDTAGAPAGARLKPLLVTSKLAGVMTQDVILAPQQNFSRANTASRILAVQVQPKTPGSGRLVVVGNGDFVSDRFARRTLPRTRSSS